MDSKLSMKTLLGIGAAAVVVIGCLIYFFRATDPAARAPIPYKKFDYGAYMQQTHQGDLHSTRPPQPALPTAP